MPNRPHRRPTSLARRPPLPDRLITVHEAALAGWSEGRVRHSMRLGELERLRRGVLGLPDVQDPVVPTRHAREYANLRSARASALNCPRAVISHSSAAIAHAIPTIGNIDRPCLTVQAGTALRDLAQIHLHRATLLEADVVQVDGYRITTPARSVMDIARERGVDAGVVAADNALRRGLADAESLASAFETCAGWPGRKAARITLAMADGAAESPLESLSRLRVAAFGLPAPKPQQEICDELGRYLGRCDFYWDEFGVVGEADGDLKYEDGRPAVVKERRRQKYFEETGLIVVRWGWSDLFDFAPVARRLRTGFARGARRGSSERRWGLLLPARGLHPQPSRFHRDTAN